MSIPLAATDGRRTAFLLAHPGHELLVFGQLERLQPVVHVLTQGASYGCPPRIERSAALFERLGCPQGEVFGAFDDQALYAQLLDGSVRPLLDLAWRLADALVRDDIECVVGDAAEGCILAHDVWRAMIDAAVELAAVHYGRCIENLEFPIERPPASANAESAPLSAAAMQRKCAAIAEYEELHGETDRWLAATGWHWLANETFRPANSGARWLTDAATHTPYEVHAQRQVQSGRYSRALTRRGHVLPLVAALAEECRRHPCA